MQTKLLEAWLVNKSQDPNKARTRRNSENSKIDSKMTPDTPCAVRTTEAKETVKLRVKTQERRHGIMPVGTLLTKIGQ